MSTTKNSHHKSSAHSRGQKWFSKNDLQAFSNTLSDTGKFFLKKVAEAGTEVAKEMKGSVPKDLSELITFGKKQLVKGITQHALRNIAVFAIEQFFSTARKYKLEFTIGIRKSEEGKTKKKSNSARTRKVKMNLKR